MATVNKLEFYLLVLKPTTALSATVSADPSDPFMAIDFTGGQTGTATSVGTVGAPTPGNTVVFTDAAGELLGNVRLRSWSPNATGTAGSLSVAENDDVTPFVESGDTFEVLLDWRLWNITPRLIQRGTEVEFFEDFDIGYTDQTVNWLPIAVAGPPAVEFGRGPITVSFVGDRSFALAPGATIATYLWTAHGSVEGTSASQGTEGSPVIFTWTAAGQYLVSLQVTDSNGNTHTAYTWAFIVDPSDVSAGSGAYTEFDAYNDTIDFSRGGGEASFTVHGIADVTQFPREAMIIHAARGSQTTPTGTWPFRANTLGVYFTVADSISPDSGHNTTSFRSVNIDGLMKNLSMHATSLRDERGPRNWTMARDITVDRAASFQMIWRSTLASMTPIIRLDYAAEIKRQDFAPTNLFPQLQNELIKDAWGQLVSSHQSVLHLARDFNLMTIGERAAVTTRKLLHKGIWLDPLDIEERADYAWPVRKVKMSGINYPGNQAEPVPLFSEAPGDVHKSFGREDAPGRLILTTQADLNTRCGFALARQNTRWHTVRGRFVNDASFDVAPQEIFPANIESADNNRGLLFTPDLIPRRIRRTFDHDGGFYISEVEFEPSVTGPAGVTVELPTTPLRTPTIPEFDPAPEVPWTPSILPQAGAAGAADTVLGTYWTNTKGATWERRINGLAVGATGTSQLFFRDLIWDPWWKTDQKKASNDPEESIWLGNGPGFIVESDDAMKNWHDLTSYLSNPPDAWGDGAPDVSDLTFRQLHADIHNIDTFYALVDYQTTGSAWRGYLAKTSDRFKTTTWQPLGGAGLSVGFGFDADAEGWIYELSDPRGATVTGEWVSSGGRTSPGVLRSTIVKTAAGQGNSSDGVDWWYIEPANLFVTTGDVFRVWVRTAAGAHCTTMWIELEYTDGSNTGQQAGVDNPGTSWDPSTITVLAADNGKQVKRVKLVNGGSGPACGAGTYQFFFDDVSISVAGVDGKPLAMDLDSQNGSRLYTTFWNTSDIQLRVYDSNLALIRTNDLGATTDAELTQKTFWAFPHTPHYPGTVDFGDFVYVCGRWDPGVVEHLNLSTDAGASFSNIGNAAWTTERVGGFRPDEDTGGQTLFAFLNGTPALWQTLDAGAAWADLGSNPFDVEFEAVSRHWGSGGDFLIGNNVAASIQAAWLASPYTAEWLDATGPAGQRLPTAADGGGGIAAIAWV